MDILHEELVPAMGCTEPIAVAYAGALAINSGLLGVQMYMHDSQFYGGDGIVVKGVEVCGAPIRRSTI